MRLAMAGIDHQTAGVDVREMFSLAADRLRGALRAVRDASGAGGCVILSTCNRTELYLSHRAGEGVDSAAFLCRALGFEPDGYRRHFTERLEGEAVLHLMRVAGGLLSGVPGDGQIGTQVRTAVEAAREAGTAGPVLEALFRAAVTAGKRVKASVRLGHDGGSVASEAVRAIEARLVGLAGRRALVIGNGVVGRLAAEALRGRGCAVVMTRREHRGNRAAVPAGCGEVAYGERLAAAAGVDVVVSATSSPHRTVSLEEYRRVESAPALLVDLAVPRDIDPAIARLPGVALWNVDDLVRPESEADRRLRTLKAEEILDDAAQRFGQWRENRRRRLAPRFASPGFPVFVNLRGAVVLMAGGGAVAARRTGVLLGFGARVRVVAPGLSPDMERLVERRGVEWRRKMYSPDDLDGAALAVAATDDRETNRRVGLDARERGVLVSVADRREECSFAFPAVVRSGRLTAGLASTNGDHALVRRAAVKLREELERFDEDDTGGDEGQPAGDCPGGTGYGCGAALSS